MLHRHRQDLQFLQKSCELMKAVLKDREYLISTIHFIWEYVNPRVRRNDCFQHQFPVTLWVGIIEGKLIGPFDLPGRRNGGLFTFFTT